MAEAAEKALPVITSILDIPLDNQSVELSVRFYDCVLFKAQAIR